MVRLLFAALLSACAATVPRPPNGPTPAGSMVEIPYPPPPARIETIPANEDESKVWVDGQWAWQGRKWKWQPGTWVTPPPKAYFTRWSAVRRPDGKLFFVRATWRDENGRPLDAGEEDPTCKVKPKPAVAGTP